MDHRSGVVLLAILFSCGDGGDRRTILDVPGPSESPIPEIPDSSKDPSSIGTPSDDCACAAPGDAPGDDYAWPLVIDPPAPPGAPLPPVGALNVVDFGAQPGTDCRLAVQKALDAAPPGGTVYVPPAPSPYLLSTRPSPFDPARQIGIDIPSGVTLFVAAGATLQMADNQQNDERGPVDLVAFDGENITVTGGGTISGNTKGQPGWTGRDYGGFKYSQIVGGCLVRGFLPLRTVSITDLHLRDAFSNPINVNADQDVRVERIQSDATGEGPQVIGARNVLMADIDHGDSTDVSQGDAVEVSCVNGFAIRRARVRAAAGGEGAVVDIFGSSNGLVEEVSSDGWHWGIEAHDTPDDSCLSDNVEVRKVSITNAVASALLFSRQSGSVRFHHVQISNCGIGVHVLGENRFPPLHMHNIRVENCRQGFYTLSARETQLESSVITGSNGDAFLIEPPSGIVPRLTLLGVRVQRNRGYGVQVAGPMSTAATIRITASDFTANDRGAYKGFPQAVVVRDTQPPWP